MERKIKTVILVPTTLEMEKITRIIQPYSDVITEISGVGAIRTACKTAEVINRYSPAQIILAGIAGTYPDKGITKGECVIVNTEYTADAGSFSEGTFTPKFKERFSCPYCYDYSGRTDIKSLKIVASNSVNAAGFPYAETTFVQIENMEGAAFFNVCLEKKVRFLELRAISNTVGEDFSKWDITEATENLAKTVKMFI